MRDFIQHIHFFTAPLLHPIPSPSTSSLVFYLVPPARLQFLLYSPQKQLSQMRITPNTLLLKTSSQLQKLPGKEILTPCRKDPSSFLESLKSCKNLALVPALISTRPLLLCAPSSPGPSSVPPTHGNLPCFTAFCSFLHSSYPISNYLFT